MMDNNKSYDQVVMVPPIEFEFNLETAKTNFFSDPSAEQPNTHQYHVEFENLKHNLIDHAIPVLQLDYTPNINNPTPDAVFPNNWFTLHKQPDETYQLVLYPMLTQNRQAEVREILLLNLLKTHKINVSNIIDLRKHAQPNEALEGTGSIIFDRENGIAYAARSPRTSERLFHILCNTLGFEPFTFGAVDENGRDIYHTNVMMSIGQQFCVLCLESIPNEAEKQLLLDKLEKSQKKVIVITLEQVNNMCGNILELIGKDNKKQLLMSQRAYDHFTGEQRSQLSEFAELTPADITTIENVGGGSVRCMLARIPCIYDKSAK